MTGLINEEPGPLARILCNRQFGVGADGLLLVEKSLIAHFRMRYFNADGSTGGMCGNGGRCVARFAHLAGIAPKVMTFEALDFVYRAEVNGETVRLGLKDPAAITLGTRLEVGPDVFTVASVDTGSPHAVLFVEDLELLDVTGLGARICSHAHFRPSRTNVNFVRVGAGDALHIRTYERGVEAETLACGTGSVAASIIGALLEKVSPPVTIHTRSGVLMCVNFERQSETITNVVLEGPADITFEGKVVVDVARGKLCHPGFPSAV
jgi:diaminopimelate epimerase